MNLFISYQAKDSDRVDSIVAQLRSRMNEQNKPFHAVWQDKDSILPGQDWWDAIIDAIIACDVFVFMVSRESAQNVNCRAELSYARQLHRPIIPIVLEGEFAYNPDTGRYDLNYWENIPEDLLDTPVQFLFYNDKSFVQQFKSAISIIASQTDHWADIPAPRPLDPRRAVESTSDSIVLYDQACNYAFRGDLEMAERLFQRIINSGDNDIVHETRQWVSILRQYDQIILLNTDEASRYKARELWQNYIQKFPLPFLDFFDPKGLQSSLVKHLPSPQSTATPIAPLNRCSPVDFSAGSTIEMVQRRYTSGHGLSNH